MTELAEILEGASDTVFQVQFHKKPTEQSVIQSLTATTAAALKDKAHQQTLVKSIVEGDICKMTCHLVEAENMLGRSTVIDLNAKGDNKFRQVDHRTIDFIILRNVRYSLKKGGKKVQPKEDEEMKDEKKKEPKWNSTKLAVGNWFSGTRYFRAVEEKDNQIKMRSEGQDITVSRDILEQQMYNASVFDTEEKISLTKVASALEKAGEACFTACFNTKVDEKEVASRLAKATQDELKNSKALASEILTGKEHTLVGRLSKGESKLGRSLVIDLPTQFYRQVDHRTLRWLVLKNVKYTVKK